MCFQKQLLQNSRNLGRKQPRPLAWIFVKVTPHHRPESPCPLIEKSERFSTTSSKDSFRRCYSRFSVKSNFTKKYVLLFSSSRGFFFIEYLKSVTFSCFFIFFYFIFFIICRNNLLQYSNIGHLIEIQIFRLT